MITIITTGPISVPFNHKTIITDDLNAACDLATTEWLLLLYPQEKLVQWESIFKAMKQAYYLKVVTETIICKEIRLWRKGAGRFVFDYLDIDTEDELNAVIYSKPRMMEEEKIERWKKEKPLAAEPYYYQACLLLSRGEYSEFLRVSEHYMFLDKKVNMSTIMNRYYHALVSIQQNKPIRPIFQNINICLAAKPLMAEFWCLMGDVYYFRLHKFAFAQKFYENAITLGKRRLATDKWPMDVNKYEIYPEKMIEACSKQKTSFYGQSKSKTLVN